MRGAAYGMGGNLDAIGARLGRIPSTELVICKDEEELARAAGDCDFLLIQHTYYRGAVEAAAMDRERLRWVQLLSAGYDGLIGRQIRPDVVVTNAGPSFGASVADHALALLLALARRMPETMSAQIEGKWRSSIRVNAVSLNGGEAVVVGFGPIGQQIAGRLRAFGMKVTAVNRSGTAHPDADQVVTTASLDEVLSRADVVMLALPFSASTDQMFDAARIARIKPGARIVNIGRGAVVDLDALVTALKSGHVAGAGLDVTEPEPLPQGHPAWSAPNMIITPHIAGAGSSAEVAEFVGSNVEAFMAGRPLQAVIDHRLLKP